MAYHGHNGTLETSWEVSQHTDGLEIDDKKYVMDTINSTYGLKGTVVKLNIER